jgi:hypothetical protein
VPYVTCACGGRVWVALRGISNWRIELDRTSIRASCPELRGIAERAGDESTTDFKCSRLEELIGLHLHLWRP